METKTPRPRKARSKKAATPLPLEQDPSAAHVSNTPELITRSALAMAMGKTYGGIRDVYEALGYDKTPTDRVFYERYKRQGIARRIVKAMPKACWSKPPRLTESKKTETPFEKQWLELEQSIPIWDLMMRADIQSRIGYYGVLFLGFDDGKDFAEPVERARKLLYGMPFSSLSAKISTWEAEKRNPRYGLPLTYSITFRSLALGATHPGQKQVQTKVHYSRILHFADDLEQDNIFSTPVLEPCLNDLENLEKVIGAGSEGFWRGAFPGTIFNLDPEAWSDSPQLALQRAEIEKYIHGFQRHLRLKGVEAQQLSAQIADPASIVSALLDMLAATSETPKRILIGSERGELGGDTDQDNWLGSVADRQTIYCEKKVKELVDRLESVGVLTAKPTTLTVEWPSLVAQSEDKQATIGQTRAGAIATYSSSPGASDIVAPEIFLRWGLGMSDELIEENQELVKAQMAEEEALERKLQELLAEQAQADPNGEVIDPNAEVDPSKEAAPEEKELVEA